MGGKNHVCLQQKSPLLGRRTLPAERGCVRAASGVAVVSTGRGQERAYSPHRHFLMGMPGEELRVRSRVTKWALRRVLT
jgi:hypothetical protein